MRTLLPSIGCAILLAACDHPTSPSAFRIPSASEAPKPSPPIAPNPPPRPGENAFHEPYTVLIAGTTLRRTVPRSGGTATNPDCPDLPNWGCQFFRITAPGNGALDITLSWDPESQPNQPLDLSFEHRVGTPLWSDRGPGPDPSQVLNVRLEEGETGQIIVWYTSRGVEFELRTAFTPR